MRTSQAVNINRGGDKVNALSKIVTGTVNCRIAPYELLNIINNSISTLLEPIALKQGLSVVTFGHDRTKSF